MADQDKIKMKGNVKDVLPGGAYKVMLDNGVEITAHVSGKIRMCKIRILPGDTIEVELSPYDLTRGRITYRQN
ncbi:MAG: translation initiation factor IF-1 [Mycoplasmoidaceae bacterium]|nr:translation initiation factor IF-1 [Mycoplasmoidaceae bacterium]